MPRGDRGAEIPVIWFASVAELWDWLATRGTDPADPGVWVQLARAGNPRPCIGFDDLLEAGIAFGWSESMRRRHDAESYLQRFTPRRRPGTSSPRNRGIARRLASQGRMTEAGWAALGSTDRDSPD